MTRGKWVALAVGLVVIAVLIPAGPELCRAAAYVEEPLDRVLVIKRRKPAHGVPLRSDYLMITRKRFDWLPGASYVVRCSWCVESTHEKCLAKRLLFHPSSVSVKTRLNCTCPHTSHAEDSE